MPTQKEPKVSKKEKEKQNKSTHTYTHTTGGKKCRKTGKGKEEEDEWTHRLVSILRRDEGCSNSSTGELNEAMVVMAFYLFG